ncbi:serine/threonine-protein kinase [Streptomyces sp. NBC_00572]|uniref:serine/threonine-protein kinase n=1 Tax=Streptomyces sp. NBC_00572 TaxID=2903664 RepID=UPI0022564624|nr:serine/threonine-protein kinase [Streptomyces sp. NBC_00572]MCX4982947.1 serine/threonine-protein kinase [Streptomyces sp. NBC_00572]
MSAAAGDGTRAPFPVPVPAGYRIGAWTVEHPLGSGAFATVYAARRTDVATPDETPSAPELPARAALKFLPTGTHTPRQLWYLKDLADREIALLRRLRSPHLIRLHETLTVDDPDLPGLDGATVLVLEEAERSLQSLLTGPTPPATGPALLTQVCEGLRQLHTAGWVHGDLKPGNVLLMKDGTARLGDFSTASELDGTHAYSPAFATPDYTPPELLWSDVGARGTRIRPTSDVWAFGVLAHTVLTGAHPLPGGTPNARRDAAVRYARGEEELRLSPELPPAWRDIISDCLRPTHEERSAHDAASLLRRATRAAAGRTPRFPRLRRMRRSRRPSGPRGATRLATATGAAVLAAALSLVMLRDAPSAEAAQGYDRCPIGHACFFTERDGQGEMCAWYDDEKDWQAGIIVCAWGRDSAPRSAVNNGYVGDPLDDVRFYRDAEYQEPLDCLQSKEARNLRGDVTVRSLKWLPDC